MPRYTAVRFGEPSGLRVRRLDLLRRRAEIVEAVAEVGGKPCSARGSPTGSGVCRSRLPRRRPGAITSGADVKVVQQMLGHASATVTLDLYGHLEAIGSTKWPIGWTRYGPRAGALGG